MGTTTQVFAGNAAVAYAAFCIRDPYYKEMARMVVDEAKSRLVGELGTVVDLGAGIGISTVEILKEESIRQVIAVEPEEEMRSFCKMNIMGEPRVTVLAGGGEDLFGTVQDHIDRKPDAVLCCHAFHLFNPPDKPSLVPLVLSQVSQLLRAGGIFAFDLPVSHYAWELPIADPRDGEPGPDKISTELTHPLYQRFHEIAYQIVKFRYPSYERSDLWPLKAAAFSFSFLKQECEKAGFCDLRFSAEFIPLSGTRVIEFMRNGWAVFFKWPPLSELLFDEKLTIVKEALGELFRQRDFAALQRVKCCHPNAVFSAVKV